MIKKYDAAALGELLVDLTEYGTSNRGLRLFEANPGGAPANVLAMLNKLGRSCAFIGKVGKDSFGDMLEDSLKNAGINTDGLYRNRIIPTTLALVHNLKDGDREFSFYRNPGADTTISEDELDEGILRSCRIFHFGSLSLTDEPARSATYAAVKISKDAGAVISFDPNLRQLLWHDEDKAKREMEWGAGNCDILKLSEDELLFLTGLADIDKGVLDLMQKFPDVAMINVTMGKNGSFSYCNGIYAYEPAQGAGKVVDTTGAGDIFCACVLDHILRKDIKDLTEQDLHDMLRYANAAAYIVSTRKGALMAVPEADEICRLLSEKNPFAGV